MKRIICVFLIVAFSLCGCTAYEKMNLAVFIENYNSYSENRIDFTSFTGRLSETFTEYSFTVKEGKNEILVTLVDENKEIKECRIILVKTDNELNAININDDFKALFESVITDVACSFVSDNSTDFTDKIRSLVSDFESAEKTEFYKNYRLIYISNKLCSEVIVRNNWYFEEETTEKPENKNSFISNPSIRTETVPHR